MLRFLFLDNYSESQPTLLRYKHNLSVIFLNTEKLNVLLLLLLLLQRPAVLPVHQAGPQLPEEPDLPAVALSEGGEAAEETDQQEDEDELQLGEGLQLGVGAGAGLQVVEDEAVRTGGVGSAGTETETE